MQLSLIFLSLFAIQFATGLAASIPMDITGLDKVSPLQDSPAFELLSEETDPANSENHPIKFESALTTNADNGVLANPSSSEMSESEVEEAFRRAGFTPTEQQELINKLTKELGPYTARNVVRLTATLLNSKVLKTLLAIVPVQKLVTRPVSGSLSRP